MFDQKWIRGSAAGRFVACAATAFVLAGSALAQDQAKALPSDVFNLTPFSDQEVGQYVMANVPETHQRALRDRANMLYVNSFNSTFSDGENYCIARVGVTSPAANGLQPRGPAQTRAGGTRSDVVGKLSDEARLACHSVALKKAVARWAQESIETVLAGIDRTRSAGGKRVQEGPDPLRAQVSSSLVGAGEESFFNAIPIPFRKAFDYRQVQWDVSSNAFMFDDGAGYCFATVGLTARAPAGREGRHPMFLQSSIRRVARDQARLPGMLDKCRADAAIGAIEVLLAKPWDESGLFADFQKLKEDGVPLPRYAAQPARHSAVTPPPAPTETTSAARTRHADTCEVSCRNGDCVRRWPNGKSERFQAVRKLNAFGQWEWDTGGC